MRQGLCADLSFSPKDRTENIRRVGEAAKLIVETGTIVLTALISPYIADRERVRRLLPHDDFVEVYCNASIATSEKRDSKGLYAKARLELISEFTGISSSYEPPPNPEITLETDKLSLEECVNQVLIYLKSKQVI